MMTKVWLSSTDIQMLRYALTATRYAYSRDKGYKSLEEKFNRLEQNL